MTKEVRQCAMIICIMEDNYAYALGLLKIVFAYRTRTLTIGILNVG